MDPDFLRELLVLGIVIALYMFGSAALMRGHTTDLSAVAAIGTRRAMVQSTTGEVRLNKRRKARLRDAGDQGKAADAAAPSDAPEA